MMAGMQALPHHTCPLCGGPNQCAPAQAGRLDVACWCSQANIAADILARIPETRRRQACICPRCAGAGSADTGSAVAPDRAGTDS